MYGKLATILSLLPFSCVKVEFMLKSSVFGEYGKLVFLAISLDTILSE
jgi:hypothetical protein